MGRRRWLLRFCGTLGLLLLFGGTTGPATAAPRSRALWLVKGDSVFFWLTQSPRRNWGFQVWRQAPGESGFRQLTEKPVFGVRGPAELQSTLGGVYGWVADLLEADDATQVLRRLRGDAFRGGVLSLLDTRVACALGRFFVDGRATGPGPFRYRFVFVDRRGREGERFEVTVNKQERLPVAPRNLQARAGDARVTLTWEYPEWAGDPTDLAIQFRILRKGPRDQRFVPLQHKILLREQNKTFSYTDMWLKNGAAYQYAVVALDPLGRQSPRSNTVRVVPEDKQPPDPPKGLVALADTAVVRLTWALSPELDVAGYRVYRSVSPRDRPKRISADLIPADEPFYVDSEVEKAKVVFYRVSAVDSSGNESELSNAVSARVSDADPPAPPTEVQVHVSSSGLDVRWQASPSRDVVGYHVLRGPAPDRLGRATYELLPASATEFHEGPEYLTPGRPIWVAVVAVDKANNKSMTRPVKAEVPDWKAPGAPVTLSVRNEIGTRVLLTWGASPSLDVRAYRIYRLLPGGEPKMLAELGPSAREYADGDVVKGQEVIYRVTAVDRSGNESQPAERRVVVHDTVPPPAPRDVVARKTTSGVELTWGRVIASDLLGFNVYRSDLPTGVFEKLNQKPLTERRYVDSSGTARHWYRVRAVDTSGNESSWKKAVRPQ